MNAIAMEHLERRKRLGMAPRRSTVPVGFLPEKKVREMLREIVAEVADGKIDQSVEKLVHRYTGASIRDLMKDAAKPIVAKELQRLHKLRSSNDSQQKALEQPVLDPSKPIIEAVCAKHGIPVIDVTSDRRDTPSVLARHEAMYRMRTETTMSLPAIGRALGGMDHSSVKYGIRRHQERMEAQQP